MRGSFQSGTSLATQLQSEVMVRAFIYLFIKVFIYLSVCLFFAAVIFTGIVNLVQKNDLAKLCVVPSVLQ